MVRSLCGEVTNSDAQASCVAGHTREAVLNLRNLLGVKLTYHCRNQNAVQ